MKNWQKKIIALLLVTALSAALISCGKNKPGGTSTASAEVSVTTDETSTSAEEIKTEVSVSEETSTEVSTEASTETSTEEKKEDNAENVDDDNPLYGVIDSDEKLVDFLEGKWTYCPYFGNTYSGYYLVFNKDMTYEFISDEGSSKGVWALDKLEVEDGKKQDLICLRDEIPEGEDFSTSFGGDFMIDAMTIDQGETLLKLIQANNGDSIFSLVLDDFAPLLVKEELVEDKKAAKPKKDASFEGILWNVNFNDASLTYLISDYCEDNSIYKAAEYSASEAYQTSGRGLPDNFSNEYVYRVKVETDEMGDVKDLQFYKGNNGYGVAGVKHINSFLTGYILEKHDYSINKGYTVEAYTELPKFIEDNEYAKEINKLLAKIDKDYEENTVPEMLDAIEEMSDMYTDGETYQYMPTFTGSVYWDYYGQVSISLEWFWYMGGVFNRGFRCINYDPVQKKEIAIDEATGKDMKEIKKLIKTAFKEQYPDIEVIYIEDKIDEIESFKYFMCDEGVYVLFDSYELNLGSMAHEVQIISYE